MSVQKSTGFDFFLIFRSMRWMFRAALAAVILVCAAEGAPMSYGLGLFGGIERGAKCTLHSIGGVWDWDEWDWDKYDEGNDYRDEFFERYYIGEQDYRYRMRMPYSGGGIHFYFDATGIKAVIGLSGGGGKWAGKVDAVTISPDGDTVEVYNGTVDATDLYRVSASVGLFAKMPFTVGASRKTTFFPMTGIEYDIAFIAMYVDEEGVWMFNGKDVIHSAFVLSALWLKFGAGLDYDINSKLYLRTELLFGARALNGLEKWQRSVGANTTSARGIWLKTAFGFRL